MKICFASHNQHKILELNQLLSGIHEVVGLADLGVDEDIPETGETFEENSRIKAKFVFDHYKIPVFADDSGLCVDALGGAPGVYSARYAGPQKDDQQNIDLLLQNLGDSQERSAHFATVVTYFDQHGKEKQFYGQVDGQILTQRTGSGGFGYDPIFRPDGYSISFAQMDAEEKNKISHRGIAVQKLIKYLSGHE